MKYMHRILSLILVMALALSLAACGPKDSSNQDPNSNTSENNNENNNNQQDPVDVKPISSFSMNLSETQESFSSLTAYSLDEKTAYIEYMGTERKRGDIDISVLNAIATALAKTDLPSLNGKDAYEEGEASASLYVEYTDGSVLSVGFSGVIPATFTDGFNAMFTCFREQTASMPVYVPEPAVMGEVNKEDLETMMAILKNSGISTLDNFAISAVPVDENFGFTVGLQSSQGITGGIVCSAMMMTTPYSLAIVTVENEGDIQKVRDDFQNSLDWHKWVCVTPTDALIAQKGNQVLCLVGSNALFTGTKTGIETAGWQNILSVKNNGN